MLASWPRHALGYDNACAVFHLHMPLTHLHFLCNAYPKVALGSSAEYWDVGSPLWCGRMDEIFNALARRETKMPWIHGLRMLGQMDGGWPFASADSVNVGRNFKTRDIPAETLAAKLDAKNPSAKWGPRPIQQKIFA